jgi:hypothetical protein
MLWIGLVLVSSVSAGAEPATLIDGDAEHGWFFGPALALTRLSGDTGVLAGARGGWIINHVFSIGVAGCGLANDMEMEVAGPDSTVFLNMAYGGMVLEVVVESDRLLHVTFRTLLGAGSMNYSDERWNWDMDHDMGSDSFFVAEPGMDLVLNIHRNVRLGLGASYRYISGVDLRGLTDNDIRGVSGSAVLKLGKF